jgi:hypothetical protein
MRVSLLWHAVLEFTKRIPPLPPLIQASNTAALVVANLAIGTEITSKATATNPPIKIRRTEFLVMFFSFSGAVQALFEVNPESCQS